MIMYTTAYIYVTTCKCSLIPAQMFTLCLICEPAWVSAELLHFPCSKLDQCRCRCASLQLSASYSVYITSVHAGTSAGVTANRCEAWTWKTWQFTDRMTVCLLSLSAWSSGTLETLESRCRLPVRIMWKHTLTLVFTFIAFTGSRSHKERRPTQLLDI